MKITISCEPWRLNDGTIQLWVEVDSMKVKASSQKLLPEDWFINDSIFKRIVSDMADDLQKLYKAQLGRSK